MIKYKIFIHWLIPVNYKSTEDLSKSNLSCPSTRRTSTQLRLWGFCNSLIRMWLRDSKAVMHRIANPCRSVRLQLAPPVNSALWSWNRATNFCRTDIAKRLSLHSGFLFLLWNCYIFPPKIFTFWIVNGSGQVILAESTPSYRKSEGIGWLLLFHFVEGSLL